MLAIGPSVPFFCCCWPLLVHQEFFFQYDACHRSQCPVFFGVVGPCWYTRNDTHARNRVCNERIAWFSKLPTVCHCRQCFRASVHLSTRQQSLFDTEKCLHNMSYHGKQQQEIQGKHTVQRGNTTIFWPGCAMSCEHKRVEQEEEGGLNPLGAKGTKAKFWLSP